MTKILSTAPVHAAPLPPPPCRCIVRTEPKRQAAAEAKGKIMQNTVTQGDHLHDGDGDIRVAGKGAIAPAALGVSPIALGSWHNLCRNSEAFGFLIARWVELSG